ncbi:MAG: putative Ig domain-containing protein [Geothrix sp.]|nr:putative Ig domain-containing protein [Geothrix sp.]
MPIRLSIHALFHFAAGSLLALLTACGGSGNGGSGVPVPVAAPSALVYAVNPATYIVGQAITPNLPSHGGGAVDTYTVSPALPMGLVLNAASGILSGTPTVVTPSYVYTTVRATNAAGSTTVQLILEVNAAAPSNLTYAVPTATYTVGTAIPPNTPSLSGGGDLYFAVSPALPAGLVLDALTGILSGTPTAAASRADYTVTVGNTSGTTTAQLSLTVQAALDVAPAISTQPASLTVTAPQPASFSVTASGTAPLQYQWKKNGVNVGTNAATFSLATTATTDAGSYTVTVSNTAGSVTSNAALLTVNAAQGMPAFTTQPADVTLTERQNGQFVVAASGTPTPTLQWQLRSNSFASWGNLSSETNPTLNIVAATLAQNGFQVRVVATNSVGVTNSNVATLTVNPVPPSLTWKTAQLLETDIVNDGEWPQVAFNDAGNGMAVWSQYDGTYFNVWASHYVAATGWEAAELIETGTGFAELPQVVMDANGNATAVWQQKDVSADRKIIVANRYVAGTGWGVPVVIGTNGPAAGDDQSPQIAIDPSGNVIAVWNLMRVGSTTVWANRYAVGTGWGTASQIGTGHPIYLNTLPQISVDAAGNGFAVWQQANGSILNIWSNRFAVGTGWGSAVLISDSAQASRDPKIAADINGNAMAVWGQFNLTTSAHDIFANRYVAGADWGTATAIQANSAVNNAARPKIAFDAAGNAIAAWYQFGSFGPYSIWANRYVAGTGWGTETLIETNNAGDAANVSIGMDSGGNAIVVWQQADANLFREIYSNRYVVGTGWGTVALVEPGNYRTGQAHLPQIAVNANGKALVVWQRYNSSGLIPSIWGNATQ